MGLMTFLREQTKPHHERLHTFVDLSEMTSSQAKYVAILRRFFPVVAGCEETLKRAIASHEIAVNRQLCWNDRLCKSDWLKADLRVLAPGCVESTEFSIMESPASLDAFLGRAYVLEGMTLGATRIAPLVTASLGLTANSGNRFFTAYGERTGERWRQFSAWVDGLPVRSDAVAAAARFTFDEFANALGDGNSLTSESCSLA